MAKNVWVSRPLWSKTPTQTGDGEGNVQGDGQMRLVLRVGRFHNTSTTGVSVVLRRRSGWIPTLIEQGWWRKTIQFQLGTMLAYISIEAQDALDATGKRLPRVHERKS